MSNNEPDIDSSNGPQIQDRTQQPRGVVPKNAQAWVLGIIALVMILIILFSGHSTPHKEPHAVDPALGVVPAGPNAATIEDFVGQVNERAKKLAEANSALEQEQKEFQSRNSGTARSSGMGAVNYPQPYTYGYRTDDVRPSPPPKSAAEVDREKREVEAPFAPIIVRSYRQTSPATVAPVSNSLAMASPASKNASILDMLNNDALFANAIAAQAVPASPTRAVPASNNPPLPVAPVSTPATSKQAPPVSADTSTLPAGKRYTLFEGSIIETALTHRLDSTFSGPVVCIASADVYSQNGRHLLIPRGTRVLGEVRQVDDLGQQRVAVGFHRLIFPNGQSVSLDNFVGMNQIGETGLRDQVNHHYVQIFGAAIAVGAISGLAQSNTSYGSNATSADVYRQGVSSSLSQTSMHILDRFLNILPTFTILEGHRIKVYLSQDLELPEYADGGM